MKYICLVIVFIFSLFSCSFLYESDYCEMAYKAMFSFAKDMKKKHRLTLCAYGGGFYEQINSLSLSFETVGPKSLEELRELMVGVTEDFLVRINSDEKIRQYLANYPFTAANLKFHISLRDTKGNKIENKGSSKELLYGVLLLGGKVYYDFLNDEKTMIQDAYEESYAEALEIVKKKRPDLFQTKEEQP